MDIKTRFNIGDEVYTIDYVGVAGKPYCRYVVEKEKYRIDGMKITVLADSTETKIKVVYINDKHRREFEAFATREEAQLICDRRNG